MSDLAAIRQARRWVFIGDSITHGCLWTFGLKNFVEHIDTYLHNFLGLDVTVFNTGISGDTAVKSETSPGVLDEFDSRVASLRPDVVAVKLGTNDSFSPLGLSATTFGEQITEIVRRIRDLGAVPILQTPTPLLGAGNDQRERLGDFVEEVRRVADREGCLLSDHFAIWRQLSVAETYWGNGVHPGAAGHWLMAQTILQTAGLLDTGSPLATSPVPPQAGLARWKISPLTPGGEVAIGDWSRIRQRWSDGYFHRLGFIGDLGHTTGTREATSAERTWIWHCNEAIRWEAQRLHNFSFAHCGPLAEAAAILTDVGVETLVAIPNSHQLDDPGEFCTQATELAENHDVIVVVPATATPDQTSRLRDAAGTPVLDLSEVARWAGGHLGHQNLIARMSVEVECGAQLAVSLDPAMATAIQGLRHHVSVGSFS